MVDKIPPDKRLTIGPTTEGTTSWMEPVTPTISDLASDVINDFANDTIKSVHLVNLDDDTPSYDDSSAQHIDEYFLNPELYDTMEEDLISSSRTASPSYSISSPFEDDKWPQSASPPMVTRGYTPELERTNEKAIMENIHYLVPHNRYRKHANRSLPPHDIHNMSLNVLSSTTTYWNEFESTTYDSDGSSVTSSDFTDSEPENDVLSCFDPQPEPFCDKTDVGLPLQSNNVLKAQWNIDLKVQNDPGANRSITDRKDCLYQYKTLATPLPVHGVSSDGPAIVCVGVGLLPWKSKEGDVILIQCYYCPQATGTIISPTGITRKYSSKYSGWTMHVDSDKEEGSIKFLSRDGFSHSTFDCYLRNDLCYHNISLDNLKHSLRPDATPTIRHISAAAETELWHQRLGHPGKRIMRIISDKVKGVPKLHINDLKRCSVCERAKFHRRDNVNTASIRNMELSQDEGTADDLFLPYQLDDNSPLLEPKLQAGQYFQMDFGFVRSKDWVSKTEDGTTITSIDGFNSYLLVIDKATRYLWVYLTKRKTPPLSIVEKLLDFYGPRIKGDKVIRTDLGGELARSFAFQKLVSTHKYRLETTGAYSSKQNGLVERPHRDLANIMRSLLYNSDLGPQYWSFALTHAVYLKNRWPHQSLTHNITPYQALTNRIPDLSRLRIFGSRAYALKKSARRAKLDDITFAGRFLSYTGTDKVTNILCEKTNKVRTATHVTFDETHSTVPKDRRPKMAELLLQCGYNNKLFDEDPTSPKMGSVDLKVKLLSTDGIIPTRGTDNSIGYDVYGSRDYLVMPGDCVAVGTDIALECPSGTYARIAEKSGLSLKHGLGIRGGVIDPDYRGEIIVILENKGKRPYRTRKGDKIAQLILERAETPNIKVVDTLSDTNRSNKGFGSTGYTYKGKIDASVYKEHAAAASANYQGIEPDLFIDFSDDPYNNRVTINLERKGQHPLYGLLLDQCKVREGVVKIIGCAVGSRARRIPDWKTLLKGSDLLCVNGESVTTLTIAIDLINQATGPTVQLTVGTHDKIPIHPQEGVPQMHFDQLRVLGKHLYELRDESKLSEPLDNEEATSIINAVHSTLDNTLPHSHKKVTKPKKKPGKLTRRILKKSQDWDDWFKSEEKQLDAYEKQEMFGKPCRLPKNANVLDFLWTYIVKLDRDKTKKARCVCNGAPGRRGSVTLGKTYAASLDQTAAKVFWAICAHHNYKIYGADVTNAFAEAPPPKAPLYMRIDQPFRDWWEIKKGRTPLPKHFVLPVLRALQGHPESPRLWANLINSILLNDLNLTPLTTEPCIYKGSFLSKPILVLRQTDDFAVASTDETIAKAFIAAINSKMSIDIKYEGLLERFNGVDIQQTDAYIKITSEKFISKIIASHNWTDQDLITSSKPVPMHTDTKYLKRIETEAGPNNEKEKKELEKDMGFSFRRAIGELIYAMITTRPDISFPVIKLSQYSNSPAKIHFEAVKQIFKYLHHTRDIGITYWRNTVNPDLPTADLDPKLQRQSVTTHPVLTSSDTLAAATDSDWGGDRKHRRSVTGYVILLAGGAILYKTKYQSVVATSSTEAEYIAACDTAKSILYIRMLLEELDLDQQLATPLYIDNNGALIMANNCGQSSKGTRHMDLRTKALQQWVESDLITMRRLSTEYNLADAMTKPLAATLHYRHFDTIMGRLPPQYSPQIPTKRVRFNC